MKKNFNLLAFVINIVMTAFLVYVMNLNKLPLNDKIIGAVIFFIGNLILLTLLIKAITSFIRILRLPQKNLNSYAYTLYPFTLLVLYATLVLILFRLANWFAPSYLMIGAIALSVVLLVLSQLGGAFPAVLGTDRKLALRHEKAGSSLGGFEILGSLSGYYKDGIVIGTRTFDMDRFDSMHRSLDAVVIEGTKGGKIELIITSDKSKKFFTDLLAEKLNMPEKEVKSGFNFKKDTRNEQHLTNRSERRRKKFNK